MAALVRGVADCVRVFVRGGGGEQLFSAAVMVKTIVGLDNLEIYMETRPEEIKPRSGGIAIPWVMVLMAGSFVGGAFVGLHPSWLPLPMTSTGSSSVDETGSGNGIGPRPTPISTTLPMQPATQGE